MKDTPLKNDQKADGLRRKAEAKIATQQVISAATSGRLDATRLFHELQVHQVELEMQHEELQTAYEALALREERHQTILQTAMDGFWLVDENGRLLEVNEAYCLMSGYTADELLCMRIADLEFNESANDTAAHIQKVKVKGTDRFESRHIRKDGSIIDVEVSVQYMPAGDGLLAVFLRDITDAKRTGEKLNRLNIELETANNELNAFNYTVAHDLRQPLNIIYGFSHLIETLCSEQLLEECKGYVQEVTNSVIRMNCIIDALLKFASSGHVAPSRKMVDLSALALEVGLTLKMNELERKAEFVVADNIMAYADANLLRVVLDNLLGNAWKYTASREETIIEFGATTTDGNPVYFVRDNGVGFNMANAAQLFAPFHRLPDAKTFKGFGIGLATVERIIRSHDGKIWAEGEVNKGATFYFTLSAV
jgi:PAS domain S-box-containing protein